MNRAERRRQQKRDKKASKDMKSIEPTSEQTKMIEDAVALHQSRQLDLAEIQYKKLLNYLPDSTLLLTNLGTIARQKGRLEEALASYARAIALKSDYAEAYRNIFLLKILVGEYLEGYKLYEWRWKKEPH